MDEVSWLDEREARAWRGLQQMQSSLNGELARRLAAGSGLSYSDYAVLVSLTEQSDGSQRLFELARVLGWEKSRLSHHLSRMVKRGLVEKRECEEDRRGFFVAVTDQGRREIEAAAPDHVQAVRSLFIDHLDADQLDLMAEISELVLERFEDQACDGGE